MWRMHQCQIDPTPSCCRARIISVLRTTPQVQLQLRGNSALRRSFKTYTGHTVLFARKEGYSHRVAVVFNKHYMYPLLRFATVSARILKNKVEGKSL